MSDDAKRDDPADEAGGDWARNALRGIIERCERQQADAEAHAARCIDRPCEMCERFVCECGEPVDHLKTCVACLERVNLQAQLQRTHSSIPLRFRWALSPAVITLTSRVRASTELVRRGLANPPSSSLLFMGPTGAGKTSLAVAMLDAWVRLDPTRRQGAFFLEASWLSRARARHKLGGDESPLVVEAMKAPLLLLDDLGQEREDRDGCISEVVWARDNAELPTWVTCGLATAEQTSDAFAEVLSRRYDGGFVRRVVEHGKIVTLGKGDR